jgi:hypothetical protein
VRGSSGEKIFGTLKSQLCGAVYRKATFEINEPMAGEDTSMKGKNIKLCRENRL